MANGCASDTPGSASTCSPFSIIPRSPPTTMPANAICGRPQPTARSPAASVPIGVPICSPPSAPSSEPQSAEASTLIKPFVKHYTDSPYSHRVEQLLLCNHRLYRAVRACLNRTHPTRTLKVHQVHRFAHASVVDGGDDRGEIVGR